jgi:hypothetical protein
MRFDQELIMRAIGQAAPSSSSMRSIVGMASQPLSSKTFDPALHGGLIAVRHVHHPDHYHASMRPHRVFDARRMMVSPP